jgi:hypothetical protein
MKLLALFDLRSQKKAAYVQAWERERDRAREMKQ